MAALDVSTEVHGDDTMVEVEGQWREWLPLNPILDQLPHQFQRGLTSSDLELTCVAALPHHLVLGTNVELVYLAHLPSANLMRLKCENSGYAVSCVSAVRTVDDMIAAGGTDGTITIFQLPRVMPETSSAFSLGAPRGNFGVRPTVKRFTVGRIHSTQITCLAWSRNGMRLFSGDAEGVVAVTDINYQTSECTARMLTRETSEIVQLSYIFQRLAVSTRERALIYNLADSSVHQVGQKPRKMFGPFGCVWLNSHSQTELVLYTSRPGLRFWSAGSNGGVLNTHIIKDLPYTAKAVLLNPTKEKDRDGDTYSFGILHMLGTSLLVSHNSHWIILTDISNLKVLMFSGEFRDIKSVAVSDNAIFVLEGGRSLSCLSTKPLIIGEKKQVPGLRNMGFPQTQNLMDIGTRLVTRGSGLIDHITKVGSNMAAKMTEHAGTPIVAGFDSQTNLNKRAQQDSGQRSQTPTLIRRSQINENNRQKAGHLRSSSSGSVQINSSGQDPSQMVQSFTAFLSSSNIISSFGKTPPMFDGAVMGEQEIRGDLEEIITGDQIVAAPESLESEPLVLRDKVKKKKHKKTDTTSTPDSASIKSEYSDQSCSPPDNSQLGSGLSPSHNLSQEEMKKDGDHTLGDYSAYCESSSEKTDNSVMNSCSTSSMKSVINSEHTASAASSSVSNSSSSLHCVTDDGNCVPADLDAPDTRPYDCFKTNIEKQESYLADILGLGCLRMDHELSPNEDDETGLTGENIRLSLNRESSMESAGCSTPSTIKERSPDPGNPPIDFYAQYYRNISLSSVDDNLEPHEPPAEDASSTNTDNRSSEDSEDVERLPSNLSEDRASCLSYGPPSGSSVMSLGNKVLGENLGDQRDVVMNSEIADVTWSYSVSDKQDSPEDEEENLTGDWVKKRLPSNVMSMSASEVSFAFVDSHGSLFLKDEITANKAWRKVRLAAKASQVSVSPSGRSMWIRFGGNVYASSNPTMEGMTSHRLILVAKAVRTICVDDEFSWLITEQGQVCVRMTVGEGSPTVVPSAELQLIQVICHRGVVWGLTSAGGLVFRIGVSTERPSGYEWGPMTIPTDEDGVAGVGLGPAGQAWVVGRRGGVYFRLGVTARHPQGHDMRWWQVVKSNYMLESGGCGIAVTSTPAGVILADLSKDIYFQHLPLCIGHWWGDVGEGVWSTICAEGVYQGRGSLACLSPMGQLFLLNPSSKSVVPLELPASECVMCVSQRPEALWVLTSGGSIYTRVGLSATSLLGSDWLSLDLSQIGDIELCHICCGGMEVVWGVDTRGGVYMRPGPLSPSSAPSLPPAWIQLDQYQVNGNNVVFTKVYVGMKLHMVWAIDSCHNVYVREAIFPELPIGTSWVPVPGLRALHFSISEDVVYALSVTGEIYKRIGVTELNYIGDVWEKIPGSLAKISATTDNELWGLNGHGRIVHHQAVDTTGTTLSPDPTSASHHNPIAPRLSDNSEESDWEVL